MTGYPSVERPDGFVPDNSLPEQLRAPEDARHYVGRRVCKLFLSEDTSEKEPKWFLGYVTGVKIEDETPFLQVDYDDGDYEEFWWEDLRKWAVLDTRAAPKRDLAEHQAGPSAGAAAANLAVQRAQDTSSRKRHAAAEACAANGPTQRPAEYPTPEPECDDGQQHAPEEHGPRSVRRRLDLGPEQGEAAAAGLQGYPGEPIDSSQEQHPKVSFMMQQTQPRAHSAPVRTLAPRRRFGGPDPWPAGHLHRIQLVHFMNHENVEVLFGKHLTFVAGNNGSGKSALLQGLQACLGTSARDTGRGTSLADWVKSDRRSATVTLEIWNTIDEDCNVQERVPFRYEIYGAIIRIVRKITVTGEHGPGKRTASGTYQLFRADGSEVKPAEIGHTAAREVAALVAHYNVDASNPLIVITQDKSRDFHEDKDGKCSKYEMYMSGTCLAATRDTLVVSSTKLAAAEANVKQHRERLQQRKEELKALEKRLGLLQKVDDLKRTQVDLEYAIPWAGFAEGEAWFNAAKQHASRGPARLASLQQRVEEAKQAVAQLKAQEAELRAAMEGSRASTLPEHIIEANQRQAAAMQRQRDLVRQSQSLSQRLNELNWERQMLVEDLRAQQSGEVAAQKIREHKERVDLKNAELARLQAEQTALEPQLAAATARLLDANTVMEDSRIARDGARATLDEARAAHRELQAAAGGGAGGSGAAVQARRWGHQAMALLHAVQAAPPRTFSAPPIGPVGMYLQRSAECDMQLAHVLELALGGVLGSWIVNTREDSEALKHLAESLRQPRPLIFVIPYRNWAHTYGEQPVVDRNGVRWQRVIDLVAPVEGLDQTVFATLLNCLLDRASAATTVLVPDRATGQAVAQQAVPGLAERSVYRAYDMRGALYEMRGTTMSTTSNRLPSILRLAADNRNQLEESAREVAEREAELRQVEEEYRAAAAAVAKAKDAKGELQRRHMRLVTEAARCGTELQSLSDEAPLVDTGAQASEIVNKIHQATEATKQTEASLRDLDSQRNNAAEEACAAQAEVQELKKQTNLYKLRRQELLAELKLRAQRVGEAEAMERSRLEEVAKAQNDILQGQRQIAEQQETLNQHRAAAEEVCSRVEGEEALQRLREAKQTDIGARHPNKTLEQRAAMLEHAMTYKGLSTWLDAVMRNISRQVEEAGGDPDSIRLQAESVRAALAKDRAAIDAVTKKVNTMQDAQGVRTSKYHKLRQDYDQLSDNKFALYMQRRNFVAQVKLDHKEERLELVVRKVNEQHWATSLLQLSGGERSFTAASFLLAMGEVLKTPFRAMDEYDVFMDADRRKMITKALVEFAWLVTKDSQLILLSPQDTATLTESFNALVQTCDRGGQPPPPQSFMKIIVLPDPRVT